MDDFPMMLYRWPAQLAGAIALQDGTYDAMLVNDLDAHDAAVGEGWFESPVDAKAAGDAANKITAEAAKATADAKALADAQALLDAAKAAAAPPSRADLEAKATELGIKFDGRTSDKKLGDLIAANLET